MHYFSQIITKKCFVYFFIDIPFKFLYNLVKNELKSFSGGAYMFTFIGSSIENLINIKELIYFSVNHFNDNYKDEGEVHNYWDLMYVTSGEIIEVCNKTEKVIRENEIVFHQPHEFHQTKLIPGKRATAYTISFNCTSKCMDLLRNYHGALSETTHTLIEIFAKEADRSFELTLKNKKFSMVPSRNMPLGGLQACRLSLEFLLIYILREQQQNSSSNYFFSNKNDLYSEICKQVINYLSDNIYSDISLDRLSKKFNYSRTFLCTKFKEITGITILQYYTNLKINEACNLIKAGTHSVSYIAELLHYSTPYYFSRTFKKVTGMSPLQYKSKHSNKQSISKQ